MTFTSSLHYQPEDKIQPDTVPMRLKRETGYIFIIWINSGVGFILFPNCRTSYLTDICCILNDLNLKLQGYNINVIDAREELNTFKDKLYLWFDRAVKKNFEPFHFLNNIRSSIPNSNQMAELIKDHLKILKRKLRHYFPRLDNTEFDWIINPFEHDVPSYFPLKVVESFIELKNKSEMQSYFKTNPLNEFWHFAVKKYPDLEQKVFDVLLRFPSTYRCEQGFSAMNSIKSLKRNRLISLGQEMRVAISEIRPRLELLCSKMKQQKSH